MSESVECNVLSDNVRTVQALPVNAVQLATLAGEINLLAETVVEMANKAVINAVKLGDKLRQAKDYSDNFEDWLAENCPRLKRSQAYNYMALAKSKPELLNESIQTTGLLMLSHELALLTAPDDVKAEVMERVEQGNKVTVKEIERLKKEKQQADEDYLEVLREKNKIEIEKNTLSIKVTAIERENKTLKTDKGVEDLVRKTASAEIEKTQKALQQELDRVVAEHESDYQARIDQLTDDVSRLKNELGKAKQPERLTQIQAEIVHAEEELRRTNARVLTQNVDSAYKGLAKHLIESAATVQTSLLELSGKTAFYTPTIELLLRAVHDWNIVIECLQNAAQVEQFDIEG